MLQLKRTSKVLLLGLIILSIGATSCITKKVVYFRDVPEELKSPIAAKLTTYTNSQIQPKDLLYISVQTLDPQNSAAMMGVQSTSIQGAAFNAPSYLVNDEGNIELPLVGTIKVGGLSISQAQDAIRLKAAIYYKDPVVNVRFANFTITVLGEVNRPGQYVFPSERTSLLDAIGLAGDLTIFGKRENVMLIREIGGERQFVRFDLNSSEIFSSTYFYLRQNDVIYVEPSKNKVRTTDVATLRTLSILSTLTTIAVLISSRIN